jgi:hypothetical protein
MNNMMLFQLFLILFVAVKEEGLFRLSGSVEEVAAIKNAWETGSLQ